MAKPDLGAMIAAVREHVNDELRHPLSATDEHVTDLRAAQAVLKGLADRDLLADLLRDRAAEIPGLSVGRGMEWTEFAAKNPLNAAKWREQADALRAALLGRAGGSQAAVPVVEGDRVLTVGEHTIRALREGKCVSAAGVTLIPASDLARAGGGNG